jgi:type IV pilus assembly protein PilE
MYKQMRGVTMIELMIVVIILGILAAVAFPNYRDAAARAKRNEAKAALLKIATNQERFYLNANTYSNNLTELGFPTDPFITDSGSYTIDITPGANSVNFEATADYNNSDNESTKCGQFTIDGRGAKGSNTLTDCWVRTR